MPATRTRARSQTIDDDAIKNLNISAEDDEDNNDTIPTQSDIYKIILDIKKSCANFNFEATVSNKIANHDSQLATLHKSTSSTSTELNVLKRRLDQLEQKNTTHTDVSHQLELQKQQLLRNNISVMGIVYEEGENLIELTKAICNHLEDNCPPDSITSAKRIRESKAHIIIVKLASSTIKDAIMRSTARKNIIYLLATIRLASI